jgi:hypothetical protein
MTNNISWTLECARLVLESDFDELEGSDDDRFGSTGSGTGQDGQPSCLSVLRPNSRHGIVPLAPTTR